jgi:hypothetical protein
MWSVIECDSIAFFAATNHFQVDSFGPPLFSIDLHSIDHCSLLKSKRTRLLLLCSPIDNHFRDSNQISNRARSTGRSTGSTLIDSEPGKKGRSFLVGKVIEKKTSLSFLRFLSLINFFFKANQISFNLNAPSPSYRSTPSSSLSLSFTLFFHHNHY